MKRMLRVAFATLVLVGASQFAAPAAEAAEVGAISMVVAGDAIYQRSFDLLQFGCPTGVLFVPPAISDGCEWPQGTTWHLSGVGGRTGSDGAVGSWDCYLFGTASEWLAYGHGELDMECYGGGVVGTSSLTDCTVRYSRIGTHITGIVTGCMTGTLVLEAFPVGTGPNLKLLGTLDGVTL